MTGALLLLLWSAGCATIGFILGAIVTVFVLKVGDTVILPW